MYSEQVRTKAIDLIRAGMSPAQVSRELGGHPTETTIKKWVTGQLPKGKRAKRCFVPVENKVEAINRLFMGEDYTVVAAELGCAPESLLAWRREYLKGGVEAITTPRDMREEINRTMRARLERQSNV